MVFIKMADNKSSLIRKIGNYVGSMYRTAKNYALPAVAGALSYAAAGCSSLDFDKQSGYTNGTNGTPAAVQSPAKPAQSSAANGNGKATSAQPAYTNGVGKANGKSNSTNGTAKASSTNGAAKPAQPAAPVAPVAPRTNGTYSVSNTNEWNGEFYSSGFAGYSGEAFISGEAGFKTPDYGFAVFADGGEKGAAFGVKGGLFDMTEAALDATVAIYKGPGISAVVGKDFIFGENKDMNFRPELGGIYLKSDEENAKALIGNLIFQKKAGDWTFFGGLSGCSDKNISGGVIGGFVGLGYNMGLGNMMTHVTGTGGLEDRILESNKEDETTTAGGTSGGRSGATDGNGTNPETNPGDRNPNVPDERDPENPNGDPNIPPENPPTRP